MITGFRLERRSKLFNVIPDMSTFGKAYGKWILPGSLSRKKEFLELGNIIDEGQERTFLIILYTWS